MEHLATVQGIITQDATSLSYPEAWMLGYEGSGPLFGVGWFEHT